MSETLVVMVMGVKLQSTHVSPYLQDDVVYGAADPVLWLHAVLGCEGNSWTVESPVFLSLQLQNKHLERNTAQ